MTHPGSMDVRAIQKPVHPGLVTHDSDQESLSPTRNMESLEEEVELKATTPVQFLWVLPLQGR
jgi:hypothetical protein